jgi:hypothetical protein
LSSGWRLPTKEELAFLYNKKIELGGFNTAGSNIDYNNYWTGTSFNTDSSWFVYFGNGSQRNVVKTYKMAVRLIRTF